MQAVLDQSEVLFDAACVERAIDQLAVRVSVTLADSDPVVICVMTGGVVFAGDLLSRLQFPLTVDYLHATRYQDTTHGGELVWRALPATDLNGRVVLVVDDILDHGQTLQAVIDRLTALGAAAVHTAVLVDKDLGREKPVGADFIALTAPDRYLFGGGMDYRGYWRNLPAIHAAPENLLTE